MQIEILADAEAVAHRAAEVIAALAREAVAVRDRFVFAVSGGRTPQQMLRDLALEDIPWNRVQVVQVDERVAPADHPDRNLTDLKKILAQSPLGAEQIHPMPVEQRDLAMAAARYASTLRELAGRPPVLDFVHLGLGVDGHTASLVPDDPVLEVDDVDVAVTGIYQGRRRMTLTFPVIDRARSILWVVTGREKARAFARLRAGDRTIPAGRVNRANALVLADSSAAGV
jgi:6-phosphogluconolactonase